MMYFELKYGVITLLMRSEIAFQRSCRLDGDCDDRVRALTLS